MTTELRKRLDAVMGKGSRSERALAAYISSAMAEIPFETGGSLAEKVGVSEATVGRFCRNIGYANLRELKDHLRNEVGQHPWLISERLEELRLHGDIQGEQRAAMLKLEMSGLVALYEQTGSDAWRSAVRRISGDAQIFVTGFKSERAIASYFANQLHYLRDGVVIPDPAEGGFGEIFLHDPAPGSTSLVIFEARRYSRSARVLARRARAAGIHVILITDEFCSWPQSETDIILSVHTQFGQFWDSTGQMASLSNLLINDIFLALGPETEARLQKFARLYGAFSGHAGDIVTPLEK